ncbi:MAG: hypothetical protein HOW73_26815 [Polyangiaceae bacterium]|nr:hypothetical protein [Polyangiaceae bacterium]
MPDPCDGLVPRPSAGGVAEPSVELALLAKTFATAPAKKFKPLDLGSFDFAFVGPAESARDLDREVVIDPAWTRISSSLLKARLAPEERAAYDHYLEAERAADVVFEHDPRPTRNAECFASRRERLERSEREVRMQFSNSANPLAWVVAADFIGADALGIADAQLRKHELSKALELAQRASESVKLGDPVFHHARSTLATLLDMDGRRQEAFVTMKTLVVAPGSPFVPGETEARAAKFAATEADAMFLLRLTVERAPRGSPIWTYATHRLFEGAYRIGDDATALRHAIEMAQHAEGPALAPLSADAFAKVLPMIPDWFDRVLPAIPQSAFVVVAQALIKRAEARGDLELGGRLREVLRSVSPDAAATMASPPTAHSESTVESRTRDRLRRLIRRCDPGEDPHGHVDVAFDGAKATVVGDTNDPGLLHALSTCMTRWAPVYLRGLPPFRASVRVIDPLM